jgi:hypothetical protein
MIRRNASISLSGYRVTAREVVRPVAAGSDVRGLEIPEKPQPPKLSAHELNALSGAVRTWTLCKDFELEELLKEVQETNNKFLDIVEAREHQNGGGSA